MYESRWNKRCLGGRYIRGRKFYLERISYDIGFRDIVFTPIIMVDFENIKFGNVHFGNVKFRNVTG